jgi:hypothetical protein
VADSPSPKTNDNKAEPPAPEVLKPQAENGSEAKPAVSAAAKANLHLRRHGTYRPSHKATFVGATVVVAILALNAGVIAFVLRGQGGGSGENVNRETVTLSTETLDKLGVSRNPVGNAGTELTVGPNANFNGKVTVGSDVSIAGELKLNSKFSANDASLTNLQAGTTSLSQLNVNGDGTLSNLNLRNDLTVVGATRVQGPMTLSQLLTVNNSVNISGNLAVGGTLSARGFQASTLTSDTTLTIGGHIITRGAAPGVSPGGALGSNGTVSISGSDAAGTIGVNFGVGGGNGTLATVSFRQPYGATPRVVVTGVGAGMGSLYVFRSATGFSVGVQGAVSPGGYAIDYIVMQ